MGDEFMKYVSFVVGSNALALLIRNRYLNGLPKKVEYVGKVERLIVYPVKSCPGIEFSEVFCSETGLQAKLSDAVWLKDRHFVVVYKSQDGAHYNVLTQRQTPRMALIKLSVVKEDGKIFLRFQAPDMPNMDLELPFRHSPLSGTNEIIQGNLWGTPFTGLNCGHNAAMWLCTFLGRDDLILVHAANEDHLKPMKPLAGKTEVESQLVYATDKTAYADWAPVLIINSKSIEDINHKIITSFEQSDLAQDPFKAITYKNFRPNIYITTAKDSYCEDNCNWWFFRDSTQMGIESGSNISDLSSVILRNVKQCTRCVLTTVDPEIGEKRKDGEPLKTLKIVRKNLKNPASPLFGINCAPSKEGILRIDDNIYA